VIGIALKGGFPVAYLFDAPGISVERQLSFGEDELFVGALIIVIAIYWAIVLLTILVVSRYRSARMQATHRTSM
jgi:heme/copper-type cytochrome/quinol oxidase subunit 2